MFYIPCVVSRSLIIISLSVSYSAISISRLDRNCIRLRSEDASRLDQTLRASSEKGNFTSPAAVEQPPMKQAFCMLLALKLARRLANFYG